MLVHMKRADQILSEVLSLSMDERADLALRILETLDDRPDDADAEEAWAAEINRRIKALRAGRAKTVSASQALAWVEARLRTKKK
jgi:putative addiction module component (TIGR02574 family)